MTDERKMYLQTIQFLDESTNDYLYLYDLSVQRVYLTDKICKKYPLPKVGQKGHSLKEWMEVVYTKDREKLQSCMDEIQAGKTSTYNMEYRIVDKSGNKVWVACKGIVQNDEAGKPTLMVGRISEFAFDRMVDTLTGLRNMDKFVEDMQDYLHKFDGCLIVLDVDNLKSINIKNGRAYGNYLLKTVANVLEDNSTGVEGIYRLDSDRFAVICANKTETEVSAFYEKIKQKLEKQCTISAGVVMYHANEDADEDVIYQYAESALDTAKCEGKNTLVFFSSENYQKSLKLIELEDEMKASVQEDCKGFYLCYQPQVGSQQFELYGAEVLLRYNSPVKGVVGPNKFIPILEQSGLICEVGAWTLKKAVYQCKEWRKLVPNFHMSVNISYVQLQQPNIETAVLDILNEAGLPGEALTLEITESIQLQDYLYFNKIFYEWKRHGIQISIDDFGTGYSSLSYLKSIDVDEAKIDRCFVSNIQYNAYNYRLLSNMIELAHSVEMKVCCEGVETEEELIALQELHPDRLQGYLFAKPCTKAEFEKIYFIQDSEEYQHRVEKEQNLHRLDSGENKVLLEKLRREEIGNIIENMDEVVYVSDIETYDLYYLNPAGRRLTGKYDYKGYKCYKVLQGRNSPCEFCTNKKLRSDEFYVWEQRNNYIGRHFILKDKKIPWQGKMARLEIGIDVTEKEVVSNGIQKKLDFEKAIVDACKAIASEHEGKQSPNNVIKIMGEFYQSDRAYILKPNLNGTKWDVAWEWCAPSISSVKSHFPMSAEQLYNKPAHILTAPILRRDNAIGLVVVDCPHCHADEKDLIDTMAYFLGYRMIGEETEARLNDFLLCHYDDILARTDLGLWVIRIDPKNKHGEMYVDKVMRRVMKIAEDVSPDVCYRMWCEQIDEGYRHYVRLAMESIIHLKKTVQMEYVWNISGQKPVTVHWLGIRVDDNDGMICLEGYNRIISDVECPNFLPRNLKSELFEYNELTNKIYFHTRRELLAGDQKYEENFPESWIQKKIVHPHFAEQFRAVFQNVKDSCDTYNIELVLQSKSGAYEWFQLKTKHVDSGERDGHTAVVLLEPTGRERTMELEYKQKMNFYEAMLSETVAYAEVDVESGHITRSGGLWASYEEESRTNNESYTQVIQRHIPEVSCSEYVEQYQNHMDLGCIRELYNNGTTVQKYSFKRYVGETLYWMELVVHTFKNQQTGNMYALLYLKNVDAQKKRELAQEIAAKQDPLTHVLNRTSFESEVVSFMAEPGEKHKGTLMMLDLDDFKTINDSYGHLKGDEALKTLVSVLQHIFREQDVIGRLGGDEFLVFVKNVTDKKILNERIEQLFTKLAELSGKNALTCSVGVRCVESAPFHYNQELGRADVALYRSKEKGKNQYSYYE